jgi:hypothetical protein
MAWRPEFRQPHKWPTGSAAPFTGDASLIISPPPRPEQTHMGAGAHPGLESATGYVPRPALGRISCRSRARAALTERPSQFVHPSH